MKLATLLAVLLLASTASAQHRHSTYHSGLGTGHAYHQRQYPTYAAPYSGYGYGGYGYGGYSPYVAPIVVVPVYQPYNSYWYNYRW